MIRLATSFLLLAALAFPGLAQAQRWYPEAVARASAHASKARRGAPPVAAFRPAPLFSRLTPARAGTAGLPRQVLPDRWFAPDKLRHFFLSFGATGVTYAALRAADERAVADWLSPSATMLAGLAKEIVDQSRGWGFSLKDLVWDAAGVAVAMIAMRETG